MWANSVWGFFSIAVALILTRFSTDQGWPALTIYGAAVFSALVGLAILFVGIFTRTSKTLAKLSRDERFLMATEGKLLKRTHFGPYPHGHGSYSYMSWDRVNSIIDNLLRLSIVKISSNGKYSWTRLGRSILQRLSGEDAQLPL